MNNRNPFHRQIRASDRAAFPGRSIQDPNDGELDVADGLLGVGVGGLLDLAVAADLDGGALAVDAAVGGRLHGDGAEARLALVVDALGRLGRVRRRHVGARLPVAPEAPCFSGTVGSPPRVMQARAPVSRHSLPSLFHCMPCRLKTAMSVGLAAAVAAKRASVAERTVVAYTDDG
ncbi:uncharacterized protein PG998_006473 [Apiospora kogelbergensis]|uniref:uncharacterized protein n=1 Tax=Apiospora kogelbergensis TaxID=1337665 RepID=UPI0031307BB6